MSGIKDYSLTPSSNTSINSIDISEGCPPSSINNAIRQEMADTRSFYESGGFVVWGHTCTYASGTSFTVSGDVTAVYVANRRLRAVGSSTGTIYGKVASSSYSAPNTTVTVTWDSGSLSNEALTVSVGWVSPTGSPVYVNAVTGPGSSTDGYIPQWSGTGGNTLAAGVMLDTDTTLAANSDTRIASQKAVKDYADASAGKPAFKNLLIGGSALTNPWQRGTSVAVSGATAAYTADMWKAGGANSGSALTVSQQDSGVTASPKCFRLQRTASNTDTGVLAMYQVVETINVKPLQGKTVTLSFNARKGANFSASGNYLISTITTGTGSDQGSASMIANLWTGYVNNWQANTLTTSFQTLSQTLTVPSNVTELGVRLSYTPTGTAGAADYFEVMDIQLEVGSSASAFEALPADVVLGRCQRYFLRMTGGPIAQGYWTNTTTATMVATFPTPMRSAPTLTPSALSGFQVQSYGVAAAPTALSLSYQTTISSYVSVTISGGATAGYAGVLVSTGGTFDLSAEL